MCESTGGDTDSAETTAAVKLTALLYEIGHVTDIEQGINYHQTSLDLVKAETFAHHFACRAMVKARYRLPLGYYLDGLEGLVESPSEYVRLGALEVIQSPDYAVYKAAVSPLYKR